MTSFRKGKNGKTRARTAERNREREPKSGKQESGRDASLGPDNHAEGKVRAPSPATMGVATDGMTSNVAAAAIAAAAAAAATATALGEAASQTIRWGVRGKGEEREREKEADDVKAR